MIDQTQPRGRALGRDTGGAPALSQMVVGMAQRARAKAAMARLRFPGVRAPRSSTTRAICGSHPTAAASEQSTSVLRHLELAMLSVRTPGLHVPKPARPGGKPCCTCIFALKKEAADVLSGAGGIAETGVNKENPKPGTGEELSEKGVHLHLRPPAAIQHTGIRGGGAEHTQGVMQRPLRLVQHVCACSSTNLQHDRTTLPLGTRLLAVSSSHRADPAPPAWQLFISAGGPADVQWQSHPRYKSPITDLQAASPRWPCICIDVSL